MRDHRHSQDPDIFIVDDDQEDIDALAMGLKRDDNLKHLTIDSFRDGDNFLDHLRGTKNRRQPAIVILDVKLNGRSGFEILTEIRSHNLIEPQVPIIFLSGSTLSSDHQRSIELKANAYLAKPVSIGGFKQVTDVIKQLVFRGPEEIST